MKYIITESQKDRIHILRRIDGDWKWISEIVDEGIDMFNPCDYGNEGEYLDRISTDSANTYLYNFFNDWQTETFATLSNFIKEQIETRLGEHVIEYYKYKKEDDEC